MTVNANTPIAGPYEGDGINTHWDFGFRVDEVGHVYLKIVSPEGVESFITSNFSGTGFGDDDGGTITYPLEGEPLPAEWFLTIYRNVPYEQPYRIGNQGNFFPQTHEDAFDNLEMQIQQLAADIDVIQVISSVIFNYILSVSINHAADSNLTKACFAIPFGATLRADAPGSVARCLSPGATASDMILRRNGAQFGTIHFAGGSSIGAISVASDVVFVKDDIFEIRDANVTDLEAQNFALTFILTRN